VAIIEWADRISALLSDSYLAVNFSVLSARNREIVLSAFGEQFCRLLDEVEGR
jgi:tRNA A37 threonylcarbamoyladenosine biosynthesis protein TsaE